MAVTHAGGVPVGPDPIGPEGYKPDLRYMVERLAQGCKSVVIIAEIEPGFFALQVKATKTEYDMLIALQSIRAAQLVRS